MEHTELIERPGVGPDFVPRRVILFSGHRIDAPGRRTPRFPAEREALAAHCIEQALDDWDVGPDDLALAQGGSGGDILFLEACRARGARLEMLLPYDEPEFIARAILPSVDGERWAARYHALRGALASPPLVLSDSSLRRSRLPVPAGAGRFERCNLWLLDTALTWGADKLCLLCLWNGGGADGNGGTAHLFREVKRRQGRVAWLDTRSLW